MIFFENVSKKVREIFAIFATAVFLSVISTGAYAQNRISVSDEGKHAGELVVAKNKSEVLRLDVPYTDLLVGSSKIADVLALTNKSIYVLGKELGTTSLRIYGPNKTLISVLNIVFPCPDGATYLVGNLNLT